ncbi:MAG TPA: FAD-dependent oxidoreductase [Polyangia bacterium]|nr:FAD-dependent oxidoreductase [Polyangia bacterium]
MSSPEQRRKVVILGGGLTGISAAVHLRAPWVLFEKEQRLGGHARTDEHGGYRFDKTGHWLHLRDPAVKQMVSEILPGEMVPVQRKARIFSNGVLTRYPFQANLHGLPPEVIKECLMGVIEAQTAGGKGAAGAQAPRNFEDYCLAHFGAGISKHFMVPYNEKLWGVSPREITADWCSRFVPLPNLEQVVAGAVGAGPGEMGYNVAFLYPRSGGIETFTRALQTRMAGGQVHTATSPDVIDYVRREVVVGGERIPYQAVVASIPLPELLKRMPGLPPEIEQHAARLRCTTLRYLNVATRSPPPADWHWIYVPEKRYPFYRVGIFSNAVPAMAPPGKGALYVELADRAPISEAVIRESAAALAEAGAIAAPDDILFADRQEIQYAYVVFDEHYYPATTAIFHFLEAHDIYPRGRYGAWTYNAMEDCVLAGREVAATIDAGAARAVGAVS